MYKENSQTLSISLPAFFVHFIDDYIATHESKSPSQVIQEALQLLHDLEQKQIERQAAPVQFDNWADIELEQAYREAAQEEFDTAWEMTTSDGLSNETW